MKVSILGTGAYGLALANRFNCLNIKMWTKFEEEKEMLIKNRENNKLLPNIRLRDNIVITNDIFFCIQDSDLIVVAIPIEYLKDVLILLSKNYKGQNIIVATKGIEKEDQLFTYEFINKYLNTDKIGIISGPTFAIDLATNNPVGFVVSTNYEEIFNNIQELFKGDSIDLIWSHDIVGVEVCNTIKNIIAIGTGFLYGRGYSNSTVASYITKAIKDTESIIISLGGDKKTILSYAGVGDIILTCTSHKSRNYSFGKMIGENKDKEYIKEFLSNNTVEGLYSLDGMYKLLNKKGIDNDFIKIMYALINNNENELFKYIKVNVSD